MLLSSQTRVRECGTTKRAYRRNVSLMPFLYFGMPLTEYLKCRRFYYLACGRTQFIRKNSTMIKRLVNPDSFSFVFCIHN
jgi:hypothetical protein